MEDALILEALDERLKLFSWTDPSTNEAVDAATAKNAQWSGVKFNPDPRVSYVRATLLSTAPLTRYRGFPLLSTKTGLYDVQCRRPEPFGNYGALALAGKIARHFFPANGENLYLPTSGGEMIVQIEEEPQVDILASSPEGGFVAASALVRYFAQVPRTN